MPSIGQVWKDGDDILLITEVRSSDDRVLVKGSAILNGVHANYSEWTSEDGFAFGHLVIDSALDEADDR